MNNLLHLKGPMNSNSATGFPGDPTLPANTAVRIEQLEALKSNLISLKEYWQDQVIITGALISVYYKKVVAKSNRIAAYLSIGTNSPNDSIVGSKFYTQDNSTRHMFTHYVSLEEIENTISDINRTIKIMSKYFAGVVTAASIDKSKEHLYKVNTIDFDKYGIKRLRFLNFIVDTHYVERFGVDISPEILKDSSIVSIFKIKDNVDLILQKLGITVTPRKKIDETTLHLDPEDLSRLIEKAPYLISMATEDITKLTLEDIKYDNSEITTVNIDEPNDEPVIGVIDTLFDESVYFSEWVEYVNMVDKSIPVDKDDYFHGTSVSSIIVDGANINPDLNDGCGKFRVRHFGVATCRGFSSATIVRAIKDIVSSNRDIKVWNLSLGSVREINKNFISIEASILDKIQFENDVVFVVAGTNKKLGEEDRLIGSPADSINSVVVNSVGRDLEPADYSRRGIVLSFYQKPDVSYYGGLSSEKIRVCSPTGEAYVTGTSFAAPWIARKLAYLIHILGFSREIAKALLIDSATTWEQQDSIEKSTLIGHGVVPIRIDDIVYTKKDEIKFILSNVSDKYDTHTYNLPVPIHNGKHPFIAKATLSYFPKCSREQGVDYTNTELDVSIGRINSKGKITPIDKNLQTIDSPGTYITEEEARNLFRKWDNTKHIREIIKGRNIPRKAYSENGLWGISIKKKERLKSGDGAGLAFALIVTLKEMNGKNRIEEFIKQCSLRGWLVNRISIENRIDIYNIAEQTIDFD